MSGRGIRAEDLPAGLRRALPMARGRTATRVAGRMNKTEGRYAALLEAEKRSGAVAAWWYEPLKFRLADRTYYTPDFMVLHADGGVEFCDVKGGHQEDDFRVKVKTVAEMFPLFRFTVASERRGAWKVEAIG